MDDAIDVKATRQIVGLIDTDLDVTRQFSADYPETLRGRDSKIRSRDDQRPKLKNGKPLCSAIGSRKKLRERAAEFINSTQPSQDRFKSEPDVELDLKQSVCGSQDFKQNSS